MFSGTDALLKRNSGFPAVVVHFYSYGSKKNPFCDVKYVAESNNELQRIQ